MAAAAAAAAAAASVAADALGGRKEADGKCVFVVRVNFSSFAPSALVMLQIKAMPGSSITGHAPRVIG